MSESDIYLTREGHDKLVKELEFLKKVKRKQLSKAIAEARSQGDISENAEYDAAREAQGLNEERVADLESKLSRARILEHEDIKSDEVLIGAIVRLRDLDNNDEFDYTLVSEMEADFAAGKISVNSPVAKGLLRHKVNDIVEIVIPAGTLKYKILKISR